MERHLRPLLGILAVFLFCPSGLFAAGCEDTNGSITNSNITAKWLNAPIASSPCSFGLSNPNAINYSYTGTFTDNSGHTFTTTLSGTAGYKDLAFSAGQIYYLNDSSSSASNGWHGFQSTNLPPGTTAQSYLTSNLYYCSSGCTINTGANSAGKGLTISLNGGAQLAIGSRPGSFANPTLDNGYYLSTPDTSGITINFGIADTTNHTCKGCIKELAFYWGSVDPGNKITFTDWDGTATTFYGGSFYNVPDPSNPGLYFSNLTSQANPNNSASYGFDFKTSRAWKSVTFSSCDYTYNSGTNSFTPNCSGSRAAFEFDNLEWSYPVTCCSGPIGGGNAPVPEPAELPVLGLSLIVTLGWVKRKLGAAKL